MAGELVKWKPAGELARRKIDQALELVGKALESQAPPGKSPVIRTEPVVVVPEAHVEIVDLARVCAVHDRPYAARYQRIDGRFRLAQTFIVTDMMWQAQYSNQYDRKFARVSGRDLGDEHCPWCGAHSTFLGHPGPVYCTECTARVCYGRTVDNYFRCRASCRCEGKLEATARHEETGIVLG